MGCSPHLDEICHTLGFQAAMIYYAKYYSGTLLDTFHLLVYALYMLYVYVIAWEGVKFRINFTSCSENGNEIA